MKASTEQLISLLEVTTTGYTKQDIVRMAEAIPADISLMIYSIIVNVRSTAMEKEIVRVEAIVKEMEERLQMYDMLV